MGPPCLGQGGPIPQKGYSLRQGAIYQHCSTKGHPPPNIDQFKVIDQEKSQIAHEAKEAIHIQKLDPELNRNVGKMVIPHVFDSLLGIKPKNPCVASLLSQEVGSQDIGINLTQFHFFVDVMHGKDGLLSL